MPIERIKINRKGIRSILKSDQVRNDLFGRAKRIERRAGPGFEAGSYTGRNRARADVYTANFEAMAAEADRKALTRAIDAGR